MTATITDLVMRMVAAGAGPIEAASVVAEAFALGVSSGQSTGSPVDKAAERRRAFDRSRKAAARQAKQKPGGLPPESTGLPQISTGLPPDKSESAPLILTSLSTSGEPTEEKKERDVDVLNTEPRARKRGARLPDDWQPSGADMQFAAGRGLRLIEIEIEATKFRNYWTNRTDKQAAKLNWSKAWQNWILNVRGSGLNAPRPGSKDDTRERTVNALRSLDPFPYADDNRGGEGAGPPIPRQLSLVKSP